MTSSSGTNDVRLLPSAPVCAPGADGLQEAVDGLGDRVLERLAAVLYHGGHVAVEFFEVRGEFGGQLVFHALLRLLQALVCVVYRAECGKRLVVEHIPDVVRLVCICFERF